MAGEIRNYELIRGLVQREGVSFVRKPFWVLIDLWAPKTVARIWEREVDATYMEIVKNIVQRDKIDLIFRGIQCYDNFGLCTYIRSCSDRDRSEMENVRCLSR
jgi:hypothetical protein